ncbi:MAG: endonuclease/exonuclease/phosphatase family protein [Alphaproteobacteria bacterium]|nr:endonuclease/exonuclease/phosphatase family protein [Alphaproteobacteria bacterium]
MGEQEQTLWDDVDTPPLFPAVDPLQRLVHGGRAFTVATYNTNSIRARVDRATEWVNEHTPDILMMQELKCLAEDFPRDRFPAYDVYAVGQQTYNGVAVLCRKDRGITARVRATTLPSLPPAVLRLALDYVAALEGIGFVQKKGLYAQMADHFVADPQARFIDVELAIAPAPGDNQQADDHQADDQHAAKKAHAQEGWRMRLCNIYLPNGNPVYVTTDNHRVDENSDANQQGAASAEQLAEICRLGTALGLTTPKPGTVHSLTFLYKCLWMARLRTHVEETLLPSGLPFAIGGDFNVAPHAVDIFDADRFKDDAICQQESLDWYQSLAALGLTEIWRALNPLPQTAFTYWDYRGGAFSRGEGLRIDHFQLSPSCADRVVDCSVDIEARARERASDHTPVVLTLDVPA